MNFERIGESLYRKGDAIYARVRIGGKLTWRSTGTSEPREARKWLKKWKTEEWMEENGFEPKGVILHRAKVTVGELIDAYLEAGMPTRKGRTKRPATITCEKACLKPLRLFFGAKQAAAVTHADADRYKEWRLSGGFFADGGEQERRKRMARMKKGTRSVDLELTILASVFHLAVRRSVLKANPLAGHGRYSVAEDIRHCREVAPTPAGLKQIEYWLRARNEQCAADVVCFLAYSGLRIGEALPLDWEAVDWSAKVLHVKREKRGIMPWVPILPAMDALLRDMQKRANSHLLFPSPFESDKQRDRSAIGHRLSAACKALSFGHVTPHGLRSYFVTQARESGLSDAEIAMLIGDKTGPAIIALTYGDVRPEHLLKQAQRIRLTVQEIRDASGEPDAKNGSIKSSDTSPNVAAVVTATPDAAKSAEVTTAVEDGCDSAQPSDTPGNTPAATLNQLVHGSSPCRGTTPPSTCDDNKPPQSPQWYIRINDQWRICFRWEGADAYNVEIVDYH